MNRNVLATLLVMVTTAHGEFADWRNSTVLPLHRAWRNTFWFGGQAPGDNIVVTTGQGRVMGRRNKVDPKAGGDVTSVDWFLGLPYAKPPIGHRRFKPPVPLDSWSGVFQATTLGATCPQKRNPVNQAKIHMDEDCLFLNIYSPYKEGEDEQRYPVMIFIHGGSYYVGSGGPYPGYLLAQHGVVVVTINYRLGVLGFLCAAHPSLSGNYGLMDQVEALKWVHGNIAEFRGDPARVTVFGNSAGGSSVGLLSITPLARGLLQYAIGQSGSSLAFWAVHNESVDVRSHTQALARSYNCNTRQISRLVDCLRRVRWKSFIYLPKQLHHISPTHVDFKPCIDGHVLPAMPRDMMEKSAINVAGYMTGIVRDEWTANTGWLFNDMQGSIRRQNSDYSDGMDEATFSAAIKHVVTSRLGWDVIVAYVIQQEYTNWDRVDDPVERRSGYVNFMTDITMTVPTVELARLFYQRNVPVYMYSVEHCANTTDPEWWACYHSIELNYVFGAPFIGVAVDDDERNDFNDVDRDVSLRLMRMWSNYAKYGDPTAHSSDTRWKQFLPNSSDYLRIESSGDTMRTNLRASRVAFWTVLVRAMHERVAWLLSHRQAPAVDTWVAVIVAVFLAVCLVLCAIVIVRLSRKLTHLNERYKSVVR